MNVPELRAEMARQNISIPRLAELINISKKTLYSRLSGKTSFYLSEIRAIAKVLHLTDERTFVIFFTEEVA